MITKITLSKVLHRNTTWFCLKFKWDPETVQLVRDIHGSRWSQTYGAWLVPFDKTSAGTIKEIFSEIDYTDRDILEISTQSGLDLKQNALPSDEQNLNSEDQVVLICEKQDYFYIRINQYNRKDRSFLTALEYSRNYLESGFWKIKNNDELKKKVSDYFAGRLRVSEPLYKEILGYEVAWRSKSNVLVSIEGKQVKVQFEWNKDLVTLMKEMPFHRWNPDSKQWSFANKEKSLIRLKEFCRQKGINLTINNMPLSNEVSKRAIDFHDPDHRKCPVEMIEMLKNRRYSESTIRQYTSMFEEYINYYRDQSIDEIDNELIRKFISYLVQERKVSPSYQNISIHAIKFYYETVLDKPLTGIKFDRPRREKRLPVILTREEVISMFSAITNLKHKFIIILLYSTGLRRGELLNLKLADIDRANMKIWVRGGKGKKDRYVQLARRTLTIMDEYLKLYNPQEYLIEGRKPWYSASSVVEIISAASTKAGLTKHVTPHKFRHSFATHMLEDGEDIRVIQELLGHSSIKTTQIYSHVTDKKIKEVVNPIDKLDF